MVTININGSSGNSGGAESSSGGSPVEGVMPPRKLSGSAGSKPTFEAIIKEWAKNNPAAIDSRLKRITDEWQRQAIAQGRLNANWENSNFDLKRRHYRQEAQYENADFDLRRRHYRQIAQYENADFDMRRRHVRQEAQWENANFDRQKRFEDREHARRFSGYEAAYREDARRDYLAMRYNADQENRIYDQVNKPMDMPRWRREGILGQIAAHGIRRAAGGAGNSAFADSAAGFAEGGLEGLAAVNPMLGVPALAALGVLDIGKDILKAPMLYASALNSAVSGAAPYYGLLSGSASLGLAGGFDGNSLTSSIYTHGAAPDWMKRYGLSPQDVLGLVQQSGQPVSSAQQARAVATSIMAASQSQFLGGLDPSTYAGMLGTFTTLSGSGNNPNAAGNFDGSGGTGGGQANDFWRRMQGVMANATAWGLDHAKVASTISSMMQQAAMSGAGHVDSNALTGFWSQMASGGLASMRDGSGILAAQQSLATESGSMGYSGNTMATMAFQNYVNHNGGLPTSMAALGKQLHFDPSTLSPAQRQQATWALQAAQRGDIIGYSSMAAPFLQTDPTLQMQINTGWAQSFGLPGYMAAAAAGGMGGGMGAVASMMAGAGPSLLKGTMLGWSDIDPTEAASIKKYAKANGLDPNIVASLINHESSFRPGAFNGSGGGFGAIGLGQIRQSALQDLQQNGMDKDVTPQMLYNADVNTRVSADYLKLLMKRYGSYDLALQHYYGSQDPNANAQYAASIEQGAVGLGSNQNQMMKSVLATQGQANTQAGEQSANLAQTLGSGPLPDALLSLNGTVVTATSTMAAFAQAVQHASFWLNALGGSHSKGPNIHGTVGRHVPVKQP